MAASAIQPLPIDTARLLSASVVVVSPQAVVKELVDNAIDAGATLVEIGLTPDTITKISVKDNGSGINEGDFDHLGRRSHTSKLRCFEELKDKGGSTLGFRGEALASMAAIGKLTITTRAQNTPTASILEIKPDGGVAVRSTSHGPVGTTIVLSNLFDNLPVRKKANKKAAENTLKSVKKLLNSYILARPQLKVAFKLLDSPNAEGAWTYNPGGRPNVREAVLQLFGPSLALQCLQRIYRPNDGSDSDSDSEWEHKEGESSVITLEAFWPQPKAPSDRVSKYGAFVSIDSRPISTVRGIGHKIYETFRKACCSTYGSDSPSSPFMQLNIRCPPGSYDPNVDPLKERLIFEDEKQLLYYVEELCHEMYLPAAENTINPIDSRPSTAWSQRMPLDRNSPSISSVGPFGTGRKDYSAEPVIGLTAEHSPNASDGQKEREPPTSCLENQVPELSSSSSPPDSIFDATEQDEYELQLLDQEVEIIDTPTSASQPKDTPTEDMLNRSSEDAATPTTLTVRTKFAADMSRTRTLSDQEDHGLEEVTLSVQVLEALLYEGYEDKQQVSAPTTLPLRSLPRPATENPWTLSSSRQTTNGTGVEADSHRHGGSPCSPGLFVAQDEVQPSTTQATPLARTAFLSLDTTTQRRARHNDYNRPSQKPKRSLNEILGVGSSRKRQRTDRGAVAPISGGNRGSRLVQTTFRERAPAPYQPPQTARRTPPVAPTFPYKPVIGHDAPPMSGCHRFAQTISVDLGALALAIQKTEDFYAREGEFVYGIGDDEKGALRPYIESKLKGLLPEYMRSIGVEEMNMEFCLFSLGSE